MSLKIISRNSLEQQKLPGRTLQWLGETHGIENVSIAYLECLPGNEIKPLHSHPGVQEVVIILSGSGKVWVDGQLASFCEGDALVFSAGSKHKLCNDGEEPLVGICIFSPKTSSECYETYEDDIRLI